MNAETPAADTTNQNTDAPADKAVEGAAAVEGADKTADQGADKAAEGADKAAEGADKPADKPADKAAEGEEKPKDEPPAKKAPEKYDLKVADGVKISETVGQKLQDFARAQDLDNAQAQALYDLAPEVNKMFTENLIETAKQTSAAWAATSRADKELSNGGDEKLLQTNLGIAAKARDAFASKELQALLNDFDATKNPNGTGLGNHPEVIRLFLRLGKAISEDNTLVTGGTPKGEKSAAQKLYASKT